MARRIARDAVVQIAILGADDGSSLPAGTNVDIEGKCRQISIDYEGQSVDLAGLGEVDSRMRFGGAAKFTIRLQSFLTTNDFEYYDTTRSYVGYRARVRIKPASALANFREYIGVITRWNWSAQAAQEQIEEIQIEGPLDV